MQSTHQSRLTGIALKIVAIAVAAAAVYVADTLPDQANVSKAHAAPPVVSARSPLLAVLQPTEVWAADESAGGTRPDASH